MEPRKITPTAIAIYGTIVAQAPIVIALMPEALLGFPRQHIPMWGLLIALGIFQALGIFLAAVWAARMLHNAEKTREASEASADVLRRLEITIKHEGHPEIWYRVK